MMSLLIFIGIFTAQASVLRRDQGILQANLKGECGKIHPKKDPVLCCDDSAKTKCCQDNKGETSSCHSSCSQAGLIPVVSGNCPTGQAKAPANGGPAPTPKEAQVEKCKASQTCQGTGEPFCCSNKQSPHGTRCCKSWCQSGNKPKDDPCVGFFQVFRPGFGTATTEIFNTLANYFWQEMPSGCGGSGENQAGECPWGATDQLEKCEIFFAGLGSCAQYILQHKDAIEAGTHTREAVRAFLDLQATKQQTGGHVEIEDALLAYNAAHGAPHTPTRANQASQS